MLQNVFFLKTSFVSRAGSNSIFLQEVLEFVLFGEYICLDCKKICINQTNVFVHISLKPQSVALVSSVGSYSLLPPDSQLVPAFQLLMTTLYKLQIVFVQSDNCICQKWQLYLSKVTIVFVKIEHCICLQCRLLLSPPSGERSVGSSLPALDDNFV